MWSHGRREAVNPAHARDESAPRITCSMFRRAAECVLRLRLRPRDADMHGAVGRLRQGLSRSASRSAKRFTTRGCRANLTEDQRHVVRQAYAGLLWSKQFYHYVVKQWMEGDPGMPPPPTGHATSRNSDWQHLYNSDVISMPDKWEYPWYAAWDLAFHMIPMSRGSIRDFAKEQLQLFLREWYMHPNGQIPAYEWNFSRRESAGARVGLLARLQDQRAARASATRSSSSAAFKSCCSTSPGG